MGSHHCCLDVITIVAMLIHFRFLKASTWVCLIGSCIYCCEIRCPLYLGKVESLLNLVFYRHLESIQFTFRLDTRHAKDTGNDILIWKLHGIILVSSALWKHYLELNVYCYCWYDYFCNSWSSDNNILFIYFWWRHPQLSG